MIPGLKAMVDIGSELGIENYIFGMAHRCEKEGRVGRDVCSPPHARRRRGNDGKTFCGVFFFLPVRHLSRHPRPPVSSECHLVIIIFYSSTILLCTHRIVGQMGLLMGKIVLSFLPPKSWVSWGRNRKVLKRVRTRYRIG